MQELLKPADAARVLQVKEQTLRVWRSQGRGPAFVKLGSGRVRYDPRDLEEWTAGAKRGGTDG